MVPPQITHVTDWARPVQAVRLLLRVRSLAGLCGCDCTHRIATCRIVSLCVFILVQERRPGQNRMGGCSLEHPLIGFSLGPSEGGRGKQSVAHWQGWGRSGGGIIGSRGCAARQSQMGRRASMIALGSEIGA